MAFLPSFKRIVFQQDLEDQMLPFTFDLQPSKLVYVDCANKFGDMRIFFEKSCIIGIDTETKPTFHKREPGDSDQKQTSIVQIAARNRQGTEMTFIIDLQVLSKNMILMKELDSILLDVFTRTDCYKIGQGLDRDFRELRTSFTYMECFKLVCSVIETTEFVKCIEPELTHMVSLKYLVQKYLNCNLVKTQQMSNWGRRPLSPEQIHYAACDALVLLRLYDAMLCEAEESAATVALSCNVSTDGETVCSDGTFSSSGISISNKSNADYYIGALTSSSSSSSVSRKADTPTQKFDITCILSTIDTTVKRISRHSSRNSINSSGSELSEKVELVVQYTKAWATPAAREWYAKQLVMVESKVDTNANGSSSSSSSEGAVADRASVDVDEEDDVTIPLPTGQGVHKHFDATLAGPTTAAPAVVNAGTSPSPKKKSKKQKREDTEFFDNSRTSKSNISGKRTPAKLTLIKRRKI